MLLLYLMRGIKELRKSLTPIPTKKVHAEKTTEDGWTEFDESVPTRKHVLPSTDKVLPAGHTHLAVLLHDRHWKRCRKT